MNWVYGCMVNNTIWMYTFIVIQIKIYMIRWIIEYDVYTYWVALWIVI